MCPEIMLKISGSGGRSEAASLEGYARRAVRGEAYPALVEQRNGRVDGILYKNLPPTAWPRLDRFEGPMYLRKPVQVRLGSGNAVEAYVYTTHPRFLPRLEPFDWDFDAFLRCHKHRYLS